ncbi:MULTISPECIES: LysR family transcriptional regulator [unclassified Pseudoalteromonas]|jgi:DNA-binding transcriptional LysR family regulator|uniref:LysR family transcriptional regulator n=1 Tax=unclassified Pseudoalteromonas TaxID=194690 RepID=UPI00072FF3BE|nr:MULTISPECIES: LysR family transcriptional regulator [unclassified Pseudoalteromonas]KTD97973.1 LysR family transcriptional regulator [Pseudoalteromonas sp. H71]MBW4966011.1 LysR family transcriptional regulator [Pseudoalteromonas sp. CR1]TMN84543.1 LysR family transcriptional regulator [Pseudoalteromonas sp. S410]TMN91240.1 LysR family transcriptional regulator [Pseudoalteromonas sp. S408]TMN98119.1 LysR family transcriptional regulator [Pseudoalteromonas sp. S407]
MKLNQLVILDAIVQSASLSGAAQRLHKTQPALTLAIKNLESQIGFELLDRTKYRLQLTEKGRIFHREAQQLLHANDELAKLAEELSLGNEPQYKICYEQLCHKQSYNQIISNTFKQFTSTEFCISSGKRFASLEQVNNGQAELGIGPWFDLFHATGDLESLPIGKLDIGIVSAKGVLPKQLTYTQLQNYPCLAMFESDLSIDSERLSYSKGSAMMKIDDVATLKSFLLSGAGWAMMSLEHCAPEIKADLLQEILITDREHKFSAQIRAFRQHAIHHGPVARTVWDQFKQLSKVYANKNGY